MATPSGPWRHISIIETPAGTPLTGLSGSNYTRPGNNLRVGPYLSHWGIVVQSKEDETKQDGLCVELNNENGRIFPKHTMWRDRKLEDAGQTWIHMEGTGAFTRWEDERIVQCATNLCNEQMKGTYNVVQRNCQTMVNLLIVRISEQGDYQPRSTLSHRFGRTPSKKTLFDVSDHDGGQSRKLVSGETPGPIDWSSLSLNQADEATRPSDGVLDLQDAVRSQGPLTINELRSNAYFWAQPSTSEAGPSSSTYQSPMPSTSALPEGLTNAEKSDYAKNFIRDYYTRNIDSVRGFQTRADALEPYRDAKVSPQALEEKERRLKQLNTNELRARRARMAQELASRPRQTGSYAGSEFPPLMEGGFGPIVFDEEATRAQEERQQQWEAIVEAADGVPESLRRFRDQQREHEDSGPGDNSRGSR